MNEEDLASDMANGSKISCRIVVDGEHNSSRAYRFSCKGGLGNCIRASITFAGQDGRPMEMSARMLAYVDPATGKAMVRLGMYSSPGGKQGHETGQQLVWESDEQCVLIGVDDE